MDLGQLLEENATLSAQELNSLMKENKDIGPERIKLNQFNIQQHQKHLGSTGQHKAINLKIVKWIAKDREEMKKLIKEQNLLPIKT